MKIHSLIVLAAAIAWASALKTTKSLKPVVLESFEEEMTFSSMQPIKLSEAPAPAPAPAPQKPWKTSGSDKCTATATVPSSCTLGDADCPTSTSGTCSSA